MLNGPDREKNQRYVGKLMVTCRSFAGAACYGVSELHVRAWCDGLKRLPSLEALTIVGGNQPLVEQLPHSITQLTRLARLRLSGATSPVVAQAISALAHMTNVQELALRTSRVPDSIGTLRWLQRLDLSCCGSLTALPKSIGQLEALQHLGLSCCRSLTALPESIGASWPHCSTWACTAAAA